MSEAEPILAARHSVGMPNFLRSKLAVYGGAVAAAITMEQMVMAASVMAQDIPSSQQCDPGYAYDQATGLCAEDPGANIPLVTDDPGLGDVEIVKDAPHSLRHFSLNMHEYNKILSSRGCGILALSTAISFQRQEKTNPYNVWGQVNNVFTKDGVIKKNEYMRFAAPEAAKHYGLKAHQSKLEFAISNIEKGASVIMLASGTQDGIITHSSHYFEADEAKDGKVHIHDPNQKPNRHFNDSWRSINWLKAHKTLKDIWVIESA